MSEQPPQYYTALRPFRKHFPNGTPVLLYHKVGARPKGVRLRALYVSPRLFTTQLRELQQAGLQTISLNQLIQPRPPTHSFVITFDDGFSNVLRNAVAPMAECRFKSIQFIVSNLIGRQNEWDVRDGEVAERLMDLIEIREWLAAGHEIGSHTRTHCRLSRLSLRDAAEEISASKKQLEDLFGVRIRHFCYPYGDTNAAIEELVLQAGYETGSTTEIGINESKTSRLALRRFLARYPTRRIKYLREAWALFRQH